MIIRKTASAGNAEKSDVLVTVSPCEDGLQVQIGSVVKAFYGDAIEEAALETAKEMQAENCRIVLDDHGALDYVIRARVEAALKRAAGEDAL